ncbi:MAG: hypothetical protein KF764_26215 [Labilithrix sp.]|nr:hypothetical protein [Labilithrix sp.]MBX3225631.1 hypothetical protein [Labilithrix sp.]
MPRSLGRPFLALSVFVLSCTAGGQPERARDAARASSDPEADEASRAGGTAGRDAPSTAPSDPAPSGPPRVDFIGRFDTRDPAGPACAWPGCRIVARFEGTHVSARLQEVAESWMAGGPSEWDVSIDGRLQPKLVMAAGSRDYELARGLHPGEHVVELYKRNEAQTGATRFLGADFGDGKLLAPPGRHVRKIEIIGDSQPAAFGIEGVGQGPPCPGVEYAAKWQDFHKSFGALLGEKLTAEVQGTVYSGKGLVKNIWRADNETMPIIFPRAMPTEPASAWDFAAYVPDVVVIMMGGNDFAIGQPVDDGPTQLEPFTDAYDAFVVTIRHKYPDAHVFLVTSPSISDAEPAGRQSRTNVMTGIDRVVARRHDAGDGRVYAVTPPVARASELTGCGGHGNPEFHRRLADDLAQPVRDKTGW